jgi:hypothetical protein
MSNFFSLLPLALHAGSPQEPDHSVVRKPRIEPAPLPKAWLEPSETLPRTRAALPFYAVVLAVVLGVGAWDYFSEPTTAYVAPTTSDGACPAP